MMDDESKKKEQIKSRQTCIDVLNRLSGVFLTNDIEVAIEKSCPVMDAENPSKTALASIKEWKIADKKCRGYLLQHLCEQDYDQVGALSAMEIQEFLKEKYTSEKTLAGVGQAVHSARRNQLYDSDSFEQATIKINNIISALSTIDKFRVNGHRIGNFTDQLKVAWIIDILPPMMGTLRQT